MTPDRSAQLQQAWSSVRSGAGIAPPPTSFLSQRSGTLSRIPPVRGLVPRLLSPRVPRSATVGLLPNPPRAIPTVAASSPLSRISLTAPSPRPQVSADYFSRLPVPTRPQAPPFSYGRLQGQSGRAGSDMAEAVTLLRTLVGLMQDRSETVGKEPNRTVESLPWNRVWSK